MVHLALGVLGETSDCPRAHHVEIYVDDVMHATVVPPCPPPPPPPDPVHGRVIVTDDAEALEGPPLTLAPGVHRILVRDVETGLRDETTGSFPMHMLGDPKRPLVDYVLVLVHDDWINVRTVRRDRLAL